MKAAMIFYEIYNAHEVDDLKTTQLSDSDRVDGLGQLFSHVYK